MALIVNDEVIANQMRVLQAASVVDSELGKRLRECIFVELKNIRDRIVSGIKFENGDPRGTAHAVKRYIASKYLGGTVSIAPGGKEYGGRNSYEAPRKVYPGMPGHRGGNRMLRSHETQQRLSYGPADRGFILRMVNSGTNPRYANGRNGKWKNGNNDTFFKLQEQGDWYRGSIAPRNFFGTKGEPEVQKGVQNLAKIIDEEFNKLFNN